MHLLIVFLASLVMQILVRKHSRLNFCSCLKTLKTFCVEGRIFFRVCCRLDLFEKCPQLATCSIVQTLAKTFCKFLQVFNHGRSARKIQSFKNISPRVAKYLSISLCSSSNLRSCSLKMATLGKTYLLPFRE